MNHTVTVKHDQLVEALKYGGYFEEIYPLVELFEMEEPKRPGLFSSPPKQQLTEKPANEMIERIADILGQSERIVRTFNKNRFLIFYYSRLDDQILAHEIQEDLHVFSFCNKEEEFLSTMKRWYDNGKDPVVQEIEMGVLTYTYEEFNRLYHYPPEQYEEILDDDSLHPNIRQFTADFLHHGLDVEQYAFFEITYSTHLNVDEFFFFLPGALVTWQLEFDTPEENMVTICPVEGDELYRALQVVFLRHLTYSDFPEE